MSDDLRDTLGRLLDRLFSLANQDEEIRRSLNELARQIVQVTNAPAQDRSPTITPHGDVGDPALADRSVPGSSGSHDTPPPRHSLEGAGSTAAEADAEKTRRLLQSSESTGTLADGIEAGPQPARAASAIPEPARAELELSPAESTRTRWRDSRPELSLIEARCRLKAEGAHWAATRQRLIAEGADWETVIQPKDREIISRAKELPDCFLWMNHPSGPAPSDLASFECLAGCFEVVADGVGMLERLLSRDELTAFPKALDLLAEAQSTLRVAVSNVGAITDTDQRAVYEWLRFLTHEHQIYVPRYMQIDDNPDPAEWNDLSARIESFDSAIEEQQARKRRRGKLLGKVRHKTSILAQGVDDADLQWRILGETVDELIDTGLPPSNLQLREYLVPILDLMPERFVVPRGLQLTLREIDQFLASAAPAHEPAEAITASEVLQVRTLLSGRSLLLIGGHRRPLAARAIEEAFGLRELIWNHAREHESIEGFAPYVARPDVAAVILAIRWSSHSFGEVRVFCEQHDKPLVRLPAGYNPKQLAAQILVQCSDRLRSVSAK
jgi:hypothetical protein